MAAVTGGYSNGRLPLDYKRDFPVQNYFFPPTRTHNFSHRGDVWQFGMVKQLLDNQLQCKLQLIRSSNGQTKTARICHFADGLVVNSSPTASFRHRGDKCDLEAFMIRDTKDEKIIVEVLKNREVTEPKLQIEPPKSLMSAVLLEWFQTEDFGDVTIVAAGGQKFRCQREWLARRSEVFRLMFTSGMREEKEKVVKMEEFDGEIVTQLLAFIYTDECQLDMIADRVYVAAHQYQLDRLKILCESSMAANLSAKTVVKIHRLATFYRLDILLAVCADFLNSHKAELSVADLLAESIRLEGGNEGQTE